MTRIGASHLMALNRAATTQITNSQIAMSHRSTAHQVFGLAAWLGLSLAAGALGAVASVDAASFYAQLQRPPWAPPASVFGPVWSVLYVLMGIASWLVWRGAASARRTQALVLFVVQLVVNALWSWLFFAWHMGAGAFADVIVLLALIALMVNAFWRSCKAAAIMMLPYLGWVAFASALTWSVWRANPALL
jgi:benzodiazapine receptor